MLDGERNSPELPIPLSAISAYAARFKMSSTFSGLVRAYDLATMAEASKRLKDGSASSQTTKKLL